HKHTCNWEASRDQRQGPDVILMLVRNQYCLHVPASDCLQVRQRILPCALWMHAAIEHQPVAADLKVVRVRANLRAPCQIKEFHTIIVGLSSAFLSEP